MKKITLLLLTLFPICYIYSQKYVRPVFDKTDNYQFHLDSVEVTKDSTFLYFTYYSEGGSWANISDNTHIIDNESGKEYRAISVVGLPFQPAKRHFSYSTKIPVKLSFKAIGKTIHLDFIENVQDSTAFNIYGIDLSVKFPKSYSIDEARRFSNQADFYSTINDSNALQYKEYELEARRYLYGNKSEATTLSVYQLAILYNRLGNHIKALEMGHQALEYDSILYGINNKEIPAYAMTLSTIASFYSDAGDLANAIKYFEESACLYKNLFGINDNNYAEIRHLLATSYMQSDSIERAVSIMQEVVEIQKNNLGERHVNTLMSMNNLAGYLARAGKYVEAIEVGEHLVNLIKDELGKEEDYALYLNNLAGYYANLYDFNNAIKYATESSEIRKKVYGAKSLEYARSLSNLAGFYADSYTNESKAIDLCTQSLIIKQSILGDDIQLTPTLSILASLYEHQGNILKAISTTQQAMHFVEMYNGKENLEYANLASNLSMYYEENGNYQEAIDLGEMACSIIKNLFGDKHIIYGEYLAYLAETYSKTNNYHTATLYMSEAIEIFKKNCFISLNNMDEQWKSLYWNKYNSFLNNYYPYYVAHDMTGDNIALLYDNLLFSKGILSQASLCPKMSWKKIQSSLKDDDIAIEFITPSSTTTKGDSLIVCLYALTLKKSHAPLMHKVLEIKSNINGYPNPDTIRKYKESINSIWINLTKELEGVRNIYFSSSNILNSIGVEYLPSAQVDNISEQYNVYRLSSTKEILSKKHDNTSRNAILYGGLDYSEMKDNNEKSTTRAGFDYLPYSLDEVYEIAAVLKEGKYAIIEHTGKDGTEMSFKSISGNQQSIIHLATHSAYIARSEVSEQRANNNMKFIRQEYNKLPIYEDKALSRSFLVLSGGNRLSQRKEATDDSDGILTAKEIAALDLHNTDLVVLSSCESGLGELGGDDATIGLQRGFKKAGVNTILMSLHKIDDEATKILMVEFYRNLMSGKSKLQSLKDAQKYLRQVEDGKYDDPQYWASFILLDGLN